MDLDSIFDEHREKGGTKVKIPPKRRGNRGAVANLMESLGEVEDADEAREDDGGGGAGEGGQGSPVHGVSDPEPDDSSVKGDDVQGTKEVQEDTQSPEEILIDSIRRIQKVYRKIFWELESADSIVTEAVGKVEQASKKLEEIVNSN